MSPSYQTPPRGQLSCCAPNSRCPQNEEIQAAVRLVREAILCAPRGWMKGQPSPVCEIVRSVVGWADPEVIEGVLADCIAREFLRVVNGTHTRAKAAAKGGCHK